MQRKTSSSSTFNLPVLLSFNELGWIAVFGISLFLASALNSIPKDHTLDLVQAQSSITNLVKTVESLELETKRLTKLLAIEQNGTTALQLRLDESLSGTQRLKLQLSEAIATVKTLTDQVDRLTKTLALRDRLIMDFSNKDTLKELSKLREQLATIQNSSAEKELLIKKLNNELNDLRLATLQNKRLKTELEAAVKKLALFQSPKQVVNESQVRQEILGLRGGLTNQSLGNVVILLDRSGSMGNNDGHRWKSALTIVETWLTHLPISNCALVTFNDNCEAFPPDGKWLNVSGTNAQPNRQELVSKLKGLKPEGATDMLSALKMAYSYEGVDTIILFTDGKPERSSPNRTANRLSIDTGHTSTAMIRDIHRLCANHVPRVPINTVAIGDYFKKDFAEFMIKISQDTGGAFIGR